MSMFSNATVCSTTLADGGPCGPNISTPLDQEWSVLNPVCATMHCWTRKPCALCSAMPLSQSSSAMQLMNCRFPLELVVWEPVQPLAKPLPQFCATSPTKRR